MYLYKKITVLCLCVIITISLQAQTDSVLYARDSAIVPETNKTILFFQQVEKTVTPKKIILVTKTRKTIDLDSYIKKLGVYAEHGLIDLDQDGNKELLVYNYTSGAHCCDEIYIYKHTTGNKYQHVAKLFAGSTIITDSNTFLYNFHEQFGEFFSCYTCGFTDESDAAPIPTRTIEMKYQKGILSIIRGDTDLRSRIKDNLAKLGETPYEMMNMDGSKEGGVRKEFALNLAVYYFAFGKSIIETRRLFNQFYKFPDARNVWTTFQRSLNSIRRESDL